MNPPELHKQDRSNGHIYTSKAQEEEEEESNSDKVRFKQRKSRYESNISIRIDKNIYRGRKICYESA